MTLLERIEEAASHAAVWDEVTIDVQAIVNDHIAQRLGLGNACSFLINLQCLRARLAGYHGSIKLLNENLLHSFIMLRIRECLSQKSPERIGTWKDGV